MMQFVSDDMYLHTKQDQVWSINKKHVGQWWAILRPHVPIIMSIEYQSDSKIQVWMYLPCQCVRFTRPWLPKAAHLANLKWLNDPGPNYKPPSHFKFMYVSICMYTYMYTSKIYNNI